MKQFRNFIFISSRAISKKQSKPLQNLIKSQGSRDKCSNSSTAYPFLQLAQYIPIKIRSASPDMTTVYKL